jgi:hypothetical protein
MWVDRADLQVLKGEPKLRTVELGGGRQQGINFCQRCNTVLWMEPPGNPLNAILSPGTLQALHQFEPVAHVWTRSALPWIEIPSDAEKFGTFPQDSDELRRLWQEKAARP